MPYLLNSCICLVGHLSFTLPWFGSYRFLRLIANECYFLSWSCRWDQASLPCCYPCVTFQPVLEHLPVSWVSLWTCWEQVTQPFPHVLRNLLNTFLHSQTLTLRNSPPGPIYAVQPSSFNFGEILPWLQKDSVLEILKTHTLPILPFLSSYWLLFSWWVLLNWCWMCFCCSAQWCWAGSLRWLAVLDFCYPTKDRSNRCLTVLASWGHRVWPFWGWAHRGGRTIHSICCSWWSL